MAAPIRLTKRWTLGQRIGAGGFGKVYEAQSEDGEMAVIKLIPKTPGADRELLIAAELTGVPSVVPVLDSGESGKNWVLLMPRAERSLRDELVAQGGRLSPTDVVSILTEIATALAAIEGKVVHRDLKPENVLLLNGRWSLTDFGISRYAEASTGPDTWKLAMSVRYAAPERWRMERATVATDVYSVGVMGYEMLAGSWPFSGPAPEDYARQHQAEDPQPLTGVPPLLASLIMECLYKPAAARPAPANLLARLPSTLLAPSPAASRLQEANQAIIEQRATELARTAVAKDAVAQRAELARVASASLEGIGSQLRNAIVDAAPAAASDPRSRTLGWSLSLGDASISMEPGMPCRVEDWGDWHPAFDVIARASVGVKIPADRYGYEGRSHSLWYCDAQASGVFRWFETAFMVGALIPRRGRQDPFALSPGPDAREAIGPWTGAFQVAWPFTPIDQGNEVDFVERWVDWFASAAAGNLQHPSSMPERDGQGSWRR